MVIMVAAGIDHHTIAAINLGGAAIGFLGSLFFTYDVLGRPGGLLHWILRIVLPAAVGAGVMAALVAVVALGIFQRPPETVGPVVIAFSAGGILLGLFNGIFVESPSKLSSAHGGFSIRDGLIGLVLTSVGAVLYSLVGPDVLNVPTSTGALLALVGVAALCGPLRCCGRRHLALHQPKHAS